MIDTAPPPPIEQRPRSPSPFRLTGLRLSLAVFLGLMALTNLILAFVPTPYDASFRVPRTTVRGWEQILRDAEAAHAQGNPVIVVLGDSVGWGYASPRADQTLPYGIQKALNALPPEQRPPAFRSGTPKVFNLCAMAAYAPDHYALLLRFLDVADTVVMQVYPGHYSEPYLEKINFPSYSVLVKRLDPSDPLSRTLIQAQPEEHYPQRLLGGVERPISLASHALLPLVAKKDYFLSRSGLELTDPQTLIRRRTSVSAYLPFSALPPGKQEDLRKSYEDQFRFADGPKTTRALRYYEGILQKCRERGLPVFVAVTPWSPLIRETHDANPAYRARMAQMEAMTLRHGGVWRDYNDPDSPLRFSPDDYHDYSHLLAKPLVRLGEQVAHDLLDSGAVTAQR